MHEPDLCLVDDDCYEEAFACKKHYDALRSRLTEAETLLREARKRTEYIGTLYGDLYVKIDAFLNRENDRDDI